MNKKRESRNSDSISDQDQWTAKFRVLKCESEAKQEMEAKKTKLDGRIATAWQ